jgi:hypothetical protein
MKNNRKNRNLLVIRFANHERKRRECRWGFPCLVKKYMGPVLWAELKK